MHKLGLCAQIYYPISNKLTLSSTKNVTREVSTMVKTSDTTKSGCISQEIVTKLVELISHHTVEFKIYKKSNKLCLVLYHVFLMVLAPQLPRKNITVRYLMIRQAVDTMKNKSVHFRAVNPPFDFKPVVKQGGVNDMVLESNYGIIRK